MSFFMVYYIQHEEDISIDNEIKVLISCPIQVGLKYDETMYNFSTNVLRIQNGKNFYGFFDIDTQQIFVLEDDYEDSNYEEWYEE